MKILFLNYEYPPLGGGAGVATEALLREWKDDPEMEVHLVTSAIGKRCERSLLGSSVHIHRLPIGKDPEKLHSQSSRELLAYFFAALVFLPGFIRRENKKGKFDATLAFFTVPCAALAFVAKLLYGIPYAVSLRGADVPGFSEKYDKLYLFLRPAIIFLWKQASRVIPNSIGIRDLARKTSAGQQMDIIENGIDTKMFFPGEPRNQDAPLVFLSTSRLTKRKRINTLIRAFAEASKKPSFRAELHIISDGEERESLEALSAGLGVRDRVTFLGRVEHEALPGQYRKADVFVLPSKNEGMSNSALEALASGLPLVVSATGGMEEIVTDGQNGFYVDPTDTQAFAEILSRFFEKRELASLLGGESRRRALERSWTRSAEKFKGALSEIRKSRV